MDRFVQNENLTHLKKQLVFATDEAKRRPIERLIAEAEAKCPPADK